LCNSGHIQSILNPPGNPKARYMTSSEMPADTRAWHESATKRTDSWWLHWQTSLAERAGNLKKAPANLGNKKHPAAEAAPGTYVHERLSPGCAAPLAARDVPLATPAWPDAAHQARAWSCRKQPGRRLAALNSTVPRACR